MERFLQNYAPSDCTPATTQLIEKFKDKLPQSLLDLWKNAGLGKYRQGLIEIINPEEYEDTLWTWLGKEVDNYVPIAISAFGDLYYYRLLHLPENQEGIVEFEEDVCVVDIHDREIRTCKWSMDEFFNDYLTDEDVMNFFLRVDLFKEATLKEGYLSNGEIYYFAPALLFGGLEKADNVQKGDARVHQALLFDMGL